MLFHLGPILAEEKTTTQKNTDVPRMLCVCIYTCVGITDCGLQQISPAAWITGLRSILSVVSI